MANLTRYKQKIFANNSDQVGVFGTGTDKVASKNVETLQSSAYENGWSSAIITNKNYPVWQERDGVDYGFSYQLAYLLQKGIPDWLSTETYYQSDFCKMGNVIYYSLQDNNVGHNPSNTSGYWTEFSGGASRNIGEIVPSTMPLTDAGLHLLDGTLISGDGSYSAFVNYMAQLYADDSTADYFAQSQGQTPAVESNFTQPVLSANGTMGGDSFAASASSEYSTWKAWQAFNGETTGNEGWESNSTTDAWIQFYNPTGLKVSQLDLLNFYRDIATFKYEGGSVEASNDGTNWVQLCTFTANQTAGGTTTVSVNSSNFYKYHRINCHKATAGYIILQEITITATYISTPASGGKTAEEWWQEQVTNYGVCDKFVYDIDNNTVRLPKYGSQIFTKSPSGTVPVVGTGKTLGIINGTQTGGWQNASANNNSQFGVGKEGTDVGTAYTTTYGTAAVTIGITTDGTKSGIVADLSNITNYPLNCYYYIVIATTTNTGIEVDIDEIATDLNGKADTDLTNTSPSSSFAATLNTAGIRTVVYQTTSNGCEIRVWSDGFKEISCKQITNASAAAVDIAYPTNGTSYAFTAAPVLIVNQYADTTATTGLAYRTEGYARSATGFSVYFAAANASISYYACGY